MRRFLRRLLRDRRTIEVPRAIWCWILYFIILPLTFMSGVFYSIHSLPPFWQTVSHLNPIFYMIDGFRYGFFGVGDVSPVFSLSVVAASFACLSAFTLWLLRRGYKLRH